MELATNFPVRLQSARLRLREPRDTDREALARLADDPVAAGEPRATGRRAGPGQLRLVIETRRGRRLAGSIGLFDIDRAAGTAEMGTWLGRGFRGRGINEEAKALLLDHAFGRLGLRHVRFHARADNLRSQRALRRLGAVQEGYISSALASGGRRHDVVLFGIWRDED